MAVSGTNSRQSELGDFLRSRRQKLTPKAVGLPVGRRRRTPGLRREEVAELAGIGVDWYVRLEQGRSVSPSAATIDALARALRLTKAEHRHLTELTQNADRRPFVRETVPPAIRRTVEQLNLPAYVTGRRWDILAWNAAAEEIFAFSRLAEADRNSLLSVLTNPATRRLFGASWADEARASSPSSVQHMTCGPAIPPSATCWRVCAKAVPNLQAGGRPMTSAASRQDGNP
jgi:transcriptional regulator with XRE-family HTH domain